MSHEEYYTKIVSIGKNQWRVDVISSSNDMNMDRFYVHKEDGKYVLCAYYSYGEEVAHVATLHQTRTAALSIFRANLSRIESEIEGEHKQPEPDDTYTDFATGHVLPKNTITVEVALHEELDAFSVDIFTAEASIDFKPKRGFSQLVLFRNTERYMCLPIYIWTDNRVLADNQISLESLRRAFGRIETYLQIIGEPTAEPDLYLTPQEIATYTAEDADAFGNDDVMNFKAPFDHEVRENMLQYVYLGSWLHWSPDRQIGAYDMSGTVVYDLETSEEVVRLHAEKEVRGSVLAITHSIFSEWCERFGEDMNDFHHCPFVEKRVD